MVKRWRHSHAAVIISGLQGSCWSGASVRTAAALPLSVTRTRTCLGRHLGRRVLVGLTPYGPPSWGKKPFSRKEWEVPTGDCTVGGVVLAAQAALSSD